MDADLQLADTRDQVECLQEAYCLQNLQIQ